MRKLQILAMAVLILVVGGCTRAYWREGTSYKEAKEDADRCYELTVDAWKRGEISWVRSQTKPYLDNCMSQKGYVLRNRSEVYVPPAAKKLEGFGEGASIVGTEKEKGQVVIGTGWEHYHKPGCPKVIDARKGHLVDIKRANELGYTACPICKP